MMVHLFFGEVRMLLFGSIKPCLKFTKLNEITDGFLFEKYLELIAIWFTDEWGYLHDKNKTREQAIEDRKGSLAENADKIYLAFYGALVVGAFRIENKTFEEELINSQIRKGLRDELQTREIWFIYVAPTYRNIGAGRQIIQEIKRLAKAEMGAGIVLLETLRPNLNRFYRMEDAELVCESHLNCNPTDVLRIKL